MDSSKAPDLIGENYIAFAQNVTCRGGKPRTRPKFTQLGLTESEATTQLHDLQFQGRFDYYDMTLGQTVIIQIHGGYVLRIDPLTGDVDNLNPADPNNATAYHWFVQADKFMVIQNGTDIPLIWDGTTMRRSYTGTNNPSVNNSSITRVGTTVTVTTAVAHGYSTNEYIQIDGTVPNGYIGQYYITVTSPTTFTFEADSTIVTPATTPGTSRRAPEIPTGLYMEYILGRIALVSSDRKTIKVGDIIRGDVASNVANVLRFTEQQYISEAAEFSLPASQGRIAGIKAIPLQDTSTAQGGLMVFGERGTSSIDLSKERSTWQSSPIQQVTFLDIGASAQNSIIGFNGDLIFRDHLGIRSYRSARGDLNTYGQTPISSEVSRILDNDGPTQLAYISSVKFDNRLLMTCTPVFAARPGGGTDIYHRGLVVLDFTTLSGAGGKSSAAWDGVWTGLQIQSLGTGIYQGSTRCYASVYGDDFKNYIWRITADDGADEPLDQDPTPIQCAVETKSFSFNSEYDLKELLRFDIWISALIGSASFRVYYRNDSESCWTPWFLGSDGNSFTRCNSVGNPLAETNPNSDGLSQARPGMRPQITLPTPTFGCNPETSKDQRGFFETQLRIEWTGNVTLDKYRLLARQLYENQKATCPQGAF